MSSVIPTRSDDEGPRPHLVISGHDDGIPALAYLPDGRRVVAGSHDRTVKVWNVGNGGQEGTSMEHEDEVESLVVTRDGTKIINGDTGGRIKVWDVESHELVREWTREGRCSTIAVSPDDRLIAVGGWNDVGIYTMEGRLVNDIKVDRIARSVSFSPDGKKLACGTWNDIYVYDVDTGALVLGPLKGHKDLVDSVLWSRDGSRLFSGSGDNTIHCWNSDSGEQIGQPWTGHTHWIASLSLSPDGSILASASDDETIRFWDATSGQPVGQPLQHDKRVTTVCFSPSGESVASADWNGKLYLWRVPWLDFVESRTRHATIAMTTCNAVHYAQPPFFHAPPPYYMHFPSADQVLDRDPGLLAIAHPIASYAVPNSHPTPSIRNLEPNEDHSLATASMSDEVVAEFIPHLALGLDERQRIFELRIRKMLDLATSTGLRFPGELVHSTLPMGVQHTPWTSRASIVDVDCNSMHASRIEPSMSVFRSASNRDPKKIRKIDKIKQKLVEMLREIGFKLVKGRLPWSTLEGDLQKKGYMIVNWPQGVDRDRDKGVSGISAEDADKLHDALFVDDDRIQFVRCEEPASNNNGITSRDVASSSSDGPREINHSSTGNAPRRFKVTTAEEYPNKRRRV